MQSLTFKRPISKLNRKMATRREKEEDERNEIIIRGFLKLPGNGNCINCGSLGPQYVCLNFSTFICSFCSRVHREFSHRVKNISMSKFTTAEISGLQAGGNNRARDFFFKTWRDFNKPPEYSNLQQVRDFVKFVYEQRQFVGDKSLSRKSETFIELNHSHHKEPEISEKAASVLRQILQPPVTKSSKPPGLKTSKSMNFPANPKPVFQRTVSLTNGSPKSSPSARPKFAVKKSSSTSLLNVMSSPIDTPDSREMLETVLKCDSEESSTKPARPSVVLLPTDLIDFTTEMTEATTVMSTDLLSDPVPRACEASQSPNSALQQLNHFQSNSASFCMQPHHHFQVMQQISSISQQGFYPAEVQYGPDYYPPKRSMNPFDV